MSRAEFWDSCGNVSGLAGGPHRRRWDGKDGAQVAGAEKPGCSDGQARERPVDGA